jgi:hypothetical protein
MPASTIRRVLGFLGLTALGSVVSSLFALVALEVLRERVDERILSLQMLTLLGIGLGVIASSAFIAAKYSDDQYLPWFISANLASSGWIALTYSAAAEMWEEQLAYSLWFAAASALVVSCLIVVVTTRRHRPREHS